FAYFRPKFCQSPLTFICIFRGPVFFDVTLFHLTLSFELVGTACVQVVSVFSGVEVGITSLPFHLFLETCIDSSMPPSEGFWLGEVILFSMLAFPFGLADGEVLYSTLSIGVFVYFALKSL